MVQEPGEKAYSGGKYDCEITQPLKINTEKQMLTKQNTSQTISNNDGGANKTTRESTINSYKQKRRPDGRRFCGQR
ncbi:hypothetical protein [Halomonas huangheensis]|uniref:hypothetical protein n=1 Tax=Halomonas huangheensis TaxID=1178482 RepID=UPI0004CEE076|nr:hypothetical protein [Halomonas huangheensis]